MSVERRYAEARAQSERGKDLVARASQAKLGELLRSTRDARFQALADRGLILSDEDRLKLTQSLMDARDRGAGILSKTADLLVRLRSRAFYHPAIWVKYGTIAGLAIACLTWSARNTPIQWVVIAPGPDLMGNWREPDGTYSQGRLASGARYQLIAIQGDVAKVREWRPGRGYATLRIRVADLRGEP